MEMTEEAAGPNTEKVKPKALKRSTRAGLRFPVGEIHKHLRKLLKKKCRSTAAVYLAAELEFLTTLCLKLAGEVRKDLGHRIIQPSHLNKAVGGNSDLDKLIRDTIAGSEDVSHIYDSLAGETETNIEDFQENISVIQSQGNTLKMDISPHRPQQYLTIEARHTLSLEESKRKSQQYSGSLFLPSSVRRSCLFDAKNIKYINPAPKVSETFKKAITVDPLYLPPDRNTQPPKKRFRYQPSEENLSEEDKMPRKSKKEQENEKKSVGPNKQTTVSKKTLNQMQVSREEDRSHPEQYATFVESQRKGVHESPRSSTTDTWMAEKPTSTDMQNGDELRVRLTRTTAFYSETNDQATERCEPVTSASHSIRVSPSPTDSKSSTDNAFESPIGSVPSNEPTSSIYPHSVPNHTVCPAQPQNINSNQRHNLQQDQNRSPSQPNIPNLLETQRANVQATFAERLRVFRPEALQNNQQVVTERSAFPTSTYMVQMPIAPPNEQQQQQPVSKPTTNRKTTKAGEPRPKTPPNVQISVAPQSYRQANNAQGLYQRLTQPQNHNQNIVYNSNRPNVLGVNAENVQREWFQTQNSNVEQRQIHPPSYNSIYSNEANRPEAHNVQQQQTSNYHQQQTIPHRQTWYQTPQAVTVNKTTQQPITISNSYATNNQSPYHNYQRTFNAQQHAQVQMPQPNYQLNFDNNKISRPVQSQYIQEESLETDEPLSTTDSMDLLELGTRGEPMAFEAAEQEYQSDSYPAVDHSEESSEQGFQPQSYPAADRSYSHGRYAFSNSRYQPYPTNLFSSSGTQNKAPMVRSDMSNWMASKLQIQEKNMSNFQHPVASSSVSVGSNWFSKPQHNSNSTKPVHPSAMGNWMPPRHQQPVNNAPESNNMMALVPNQAQNMFETQEVIKSFCQSMLMLMQSNMTRALPPPGGWQQPMPNPSRGCYPSVPLNNGVRGSWNPNHSMNYGRNEASSGRSAFSSYPPHTWNSGAAPRRIEGTHAMPHSTRSLQINAADSTTEVNIANSSVRQFNLVQQFNQQNLPHNSAPNNMCYPSNTMNAYMAHLKQQSEQSYLVSGTCMSNKTNLP